jgi:hypothetical protein
MVDEYYPSERDHMLVEAIIGMRNDPLALIGFRNSAYQHGRAPNNPSSYGSYNHNRSDMRVHPDLYTDPQRYEAVVRHEGRHRGLRELMDEDLREQIGTQRLSMPAMHAITDYDANESLNRLLDRRTGSPIIDSDDVTARYTPGGERIATEVSTRGDELLRTLVGRYMNAEPTQVPGPHGPMNAGRRWGDW